MMRWRSSFELVKNSFDADANTVHLYFGEANVIVADNGSGMSYDDLTTKWLFVAYSSKRETSDTKDFDCATEGTLWGARESDGFLQIGSESK